MNLGYILRPIFTKHIAYQSRLYSIRPMLTNHDVAYGILFLAIDSGQTRKVRV